MNNPVVIFASNQEPATSQVAGILLSFIQAMDRAGIIVDETYAGYVPDNATVISFNYCKRNQQVPRRLCESPRFMTWLIDEVMWRPGKDHNDLIVGYCTQFQGLMDQKRLVMSTCPVGDPSPEKLDIKPSFDLALTMNGRGYPPEAYIKQDHLQEMFKRAGVDIKLIYNLHDRLKNTYQQGKKVTGHDAFEEFIKEDIELYEQLERISKAARYWLVNIILYWGLNDCFYRRSVVDWLLELGIDFKIAGDTWEWLGSQSVGHISDPRQLRRFLASARAGVHLNSLECYHRRVWEISLAGRPCIARGASLPGRVDPLDPEEYALWQLAEIQRFLMYVENGYTKLEDNPVSNSLPSARGFDTKEELLNLVNEIRL